MENYELVIFIFFVTQIGSFPYAHRFFAVVKKMRSHITSFAIGNSLYDIDMMSVFKIQGLIHQQQKLIHVGVVFYFSGIHISLIHNLNRIDPS